MKQISWLDVADLAGFNEHPKGFVFRVHGVDCGYDRLKLFVGLNVGQVEGFLVHCKKGRKKEGHYVANEVKGKRARGTRHGMRKTRIVCERCCGTSAKWGGGGFCGNSGMLQRRIRIRNCEKWNELGWGARGRTWLQNR